VSALLDLLSWLLLLAGGFFCITGGLGLLRLPDFYSRSHGGGVLDSLGALLTLAGLALQANHYMVVVKLAMIYMFLFVTGPAAIHALARAALLAGLKPQLAPPDDGSAQRDGDREKPPSKS